MNFWSDEHSFPHFLWGQKCSTGQRFICTEVTSYKIHILGTSKSVGARQYCVELLYYLMSSLTVGWLGSDSEIFWAVFRASWSKPLCRHNTRYIFRPNWSSSSFAVRVIFGKKICENCRNFKIRFSWKYPVNTSINMGLLYSSDRNQSFCYMKESIDSTFLPTFML